MDIAFLVINIIAILVAPVVAVVIAQKLQQRAAKRNDKIEIFKILVSTNAFGWGGHYKAVEMINAIPVIFADSENVVMAYSEYISACKITSEKPTESDYKSIETSKVRLLEEMSKTLGYRSEWHVFTRTYLPSGITEDMMRRRQNEDYQLQVGELVKPFFEVIAKQAPLPQDEVPTVKRDTKIGGGE